MGRMRRARACSGPREGQGRDGSRGRADGPPPPARTPCAGPREAVGPVVRPGALGRPRRFP